MAGKLVGTVWKWLVLLGVGVFGIGVAGACTVNRLPEAAFGLAVGGGDVAGLPPDIGLAEVVDASTCDAATDCDGNLCTVGDTCAGGTCVPGAPKSCDDGNPCTEDTCDPSTGACGKTNNALTCDDGDACTLGDACSAGACNAGTPKVCSGADVCAAGVCKAPLPPPPEGMVLIPAGSFNMGCVPGDTGCKAHESPQHPVALDAYYIDINEVTLAQYAACVTCTPPEAGMYWGVPGKEQHPVNGVDWDQADAYCKWTDAKGHLPSEAQWEKAARGALDGKKFPWGDSLTCAEAVWGGAGCGGSSTMPVGSKSAGKNGYGVYDMAGNVDEWVADGYDSSYYDSSPASNPTGPSSGPLRVLRGGSFYYGVADYLRASARSYGGQLSGGATSGFRCSRSLP